MALDRLAPDQRAVVQLVLGQERTYDELADLLGIPTEAVRARAHAGLDRLAPADALDPEHRAQIADYLLGQQGVSAREATRELLATHDEAYSWGRLVSAELAPVARSPLPELPNFVQPEVDREAESAAEEDHGAAIWGDDSEDEAPEETPADDRPVRARPRPRPVGAASGAAPTARRQPSGERRRSSLLGGALLLGGIGIVVAALIVYLVNRDDSGSKTSTTATPAAATPTPTATPQVAGQIPLSAVGGGKQKGAVTIFVSQNGQVAFTIEGTDVPPSKQGEAYAVWLTGGDAPHRLGFAPTVGSDGKLGTSGPRDSDAQRFIGWFSGAKNVVVSRETSQASKTPGKVILRGRIPSGSSGSTGSG